MQIALLSGVGATEQAEFVTSYPLNLEPVPIDSKISKGQLRRAAGSVTLGNGPGIDRGGIVWNNTCYRVMGTKLVSVSAAGAVTQLGDVGGSGPVGMDYSFDRLGIQSGTSLYYWNGSALTHVTDEDLGPVLDMMWIDGYFMTTDGTSLVVTELSDPNDVHPLKYGSSEADPDPVTGLLKVREEAHVLNRHTIQIFQNVGGNGFPFAPIPGAISPVGCVAPRAKALFGPSFAFVGSGRNEALGVYVAAGGATKISTRAVDDALAAVADPTSIEVEKRVYRDEQRLIVHLPDESWCYLLNASQKVGEPVWYRLQSGFGQPYRLRHAVLAYGKIIVGDTESAALGELSEAVSSHFGEAAEWRFDAGLLYGDGKAGIVDVLELIGLPGRGPANEPASLALSMTKDGKTFSQERTITIPPGARRYRMQWRPHCDFTTYLGLRFRGFDKALSGFAALKGAVRPLG